MNELTRANRWIHSALTGDGQLTALVGTRIYADVAPQGAGWPAVVFTALSGPDTTANGGVRVLTRPLYLVRGISEGHGQTVLEDIADRIDHVMHAAQGAVANEAFVGGVIREEAFAMTEEAEGKLYRHLGGRYRVAVYAA